MEKYAFGVDVGGTSVKIGFFEESGKLLTKWSLPTHTENHGDRILSDIAESVLKVTSKLSLSPDSLEGVGIGLPGPVDSHGIIHRAVNLGWEGTFNVEERMKELLNGMTQVKAGNDANVAALGEAWTGSGRGYRNIIMVTLGTGVGGGIIANGQILTGALGAAGEIGHITVEEGETIPCNCGKRGCLEQYASATGMVRLMKEELMAHPEEKTVLRETEQTARDLWNAVKAGDGMAVRIAERVGKYLGKSLADLSTVLNPELIIIGGGVSLAGDILLDYIRKHFGAYVFHAGANVKFARAVLGNDGGIYGAAKLVL